MKTTLKAKVTLKDEYEANIKNYPNCDFVEDMIAMDIENFYNDPREFIDMMIESGEFEITIVEKEDD